MASVPARKTDSIPDDAVGDFLDLSSALIDALAAERRAQSRLIETIAQAKTEGDRQHRLLARP